MKMVKSTPDRRAVIALPLYTYYSVPLNNIIKKATRMNIVVVAAAGKFHCKSITPNIYNNFCAF